MTSPEFIQSATQFAHQARELFDAGARLNLLHTLSELGHPYGLLMGQSSQSNPVESSANILFPEKKVAGINDSGNSLIDGGYLADKSASKSCTVVSIPSGSVSFLLLIIENAIENSTSSGPFFGAALANSFLLSNAVFSSSVKDDEYRNQNFGVRLTGKSKFISEDANTSSALEIVGLMSTVASKTIIKGIALDNENFARKLHLDQLAAAQAVLAPGMLRSLTELGERPRNLWVGKNQVGLGTSSIHLGTFHGKTPYFIKSPQGEALAQINPGDTLGSIHVSGQANLLKDLSPLEKIEQITGDFMDLLKAVNDGGSPDFNEVQQKTLAKAGSATFIGISHLVRLFGRKTGLPTWKLDVLPELVQRFHQHDSQTVSSAFGGTRKVKPSDVEMTVITPEMRRQLTATTSL